MPLMSPGERNGNPLQYSCLEDSMDGGAWWATVHGVAKSRTHLSDFTSLHFLCLQHWQANSLPLVPAGKPTRGLGSSSFHVGRGGEGGREIKPLCRASLVGRHDFLFLVAPRDCGLNGSELPVWLKQVHFPLLKAHLSVRLALARGASPL